MELTPAALQAIYYGFSTQFQDALTFIKPWSSRLATTVPSSTREMHHGFIGKIPRMRQWIGERVAANVAARSYVLQNLDFELTIELDRNDILDDQLGLFAPAVRMLSMQAGLWPDDLVASAMQNGAAATSICFDGQPFFSASHPLDMNDSSKGTYSNLFATTALTASNYQTVRQSMMVYQGEDQKPLGIVPNLLIVPPQLELQAKQILQAEYIAPSGALGINAAAAMQNNLLRNTAELLVLPQLSNEAGVWYMVDSAKPIQPFLFQLRKAPEFVALDKVTDPNVFLRKKFVYGADSRGNAGYALPFLAARCTP